MHPPNLAKVTDLDSFSHVQKCVPWTNVERITIFDVRVRDCSRSKNVESLQVLFIDSAGETSPEAQLRENRILQKNILLIK
jgi:hypothetical protein